MHQYDTFTDEPMLKSTQVLAWNISVAIKQKGLNPVMAWRQLELLDYQTVIKQVWTGATKAI